MKGKLLMIVFSIVGGVVFTFYILNKNVFYAKEEYLIYAFQIGAFKNYDNALKLGEKYPSAIIKDDNLYKVYIGIYKDSNIVNKMIVYFENKGINIYLKNIKVNKEFYEKIDNYEKILQNSDDDKAIKKVNDSIIKLYKESLNDEEDI